MLSVIEEPLDAPQLLIPGHGSCKSRGQSSKEIP